MHKPLQASIMFIYLFLWNKFNKYVKTCHMQRNWNRFLYLKESKKYNKKEGQCPPLILSYVIDISRQLRRFIARIYLLVFFYYTTGLYNKTSPILTH